MGQKTGIELPGEKTGIVAGRTYASSIGEKWMPGDTLSAAIGQSKNSFTPIQIARYIAILAEKSTSFAQRTYRKYQECYRTWYKV